MYNDINLIIKNEKETSQKVKVKKLKNFSYILLFSVAFLSVGIFLINLRLSVNSIKKDQKLVVQNLSVYSQTSARVILLNSRLNDIYYILNNRKGYDVISNIVSMSDSNNAQIKTYEISKNLLTISFSANSLSDLDTVLNNILKLDSSGKISGVSLKVLRSDETGFSMQLEVGLL